MNTFELSIEISEQYPFKKDSLITIENNTWVKNQWPLVYFIQNVAKKEAYVGESTNALKRIKNHLANPERCKLDTISIIGSDKFNKSATLDIESNLIQYITADGTYKLQNGNFGLINHKYYQQDLYKNLFYEIWDRLIEKKIVTKTLTEIENSELFKYSPYKSLNEDQYNSVIEILQSLTTSTKSKIFISGSAGTGKTILATYLIKLLCSDTSNISQEELNEDELNELNYVRNFRSKFPNPKIGLVVAMTSLRESLQEVFKNMPGLKSSMVISPSDTFKSNDKYDLLIVDEAHRLRQYKNISWMGAFKKNNEKLGLDENGTELDWIIANSHNQIFFYDAAQSVKPSDINSKNFNNIINEKQTIKLQLKSQMRVKGGHDYISFVDDLLNCSRKREEIFNQENYELKIFEDFNDLRKELEIKENSYGLCRMVAGYSWPWLSNPKATPKPSLNVMDIDLDGLKYKWNTTVNDWVNSKSAFDEVGCIHTTQGYDLNYTAVIFGYEIDYDVINNKIVVDSNKYFDINGKKGVNDLNSLKEYIVNIYKTILYRGILGTYVYACNKNLREYLKKHIESYKKSLPFRIIPINEVKPFVNSIPLVDITAAAGAFSDIQNHSEFTWVEPPFNIIAKKGCFICQVKGESMNKVIPNGSYCLFKQDEGGSRNGKIVLVESTNIRDSDFGSGFTVKEYQSLKSIENEDWKHNSITLKPKSNNPEFEEIKLEENELKNFRVVGIFVRVLN